MGLTDEGVEGFFRFARERHSTYLRRAAGEPRPWTADPIIQHHRFTNVYRELDRTTVWFRENVRSRIRDPAQLLLATVVFRWFNRVTTGEAIFCQMGFLDQYRTAFDAFLHTGRTDNLGATIRRYCGVGPYVTGAFIINTPTGMSKLEGVLWACGEFWKNSFSYLGTGCTWRSIIPYLTGPDTPSLSEVWSWLRQHERMGDFMAYEVVTDLRHTHLLSRAPDILTWANPGPGARRGLCYIYGGSRTEVPTELRARNNLISAMQKLLSIARHVPEHWPGDLPADQSPPWEMREVEHTLCEYAKYEMVRRGEGRTKGAFRGV